MFMDIIFLSHNLKLFVCPRRLLISYEDDIAMIWSLNDMFS